MSHKQELLNRAIAEYKKTADSASSRIGRVIGFGIGPKFINDVPTSRESFRFYVENKIRPIAALEPAVRIKRRYNGFPTDVIETGRPISFQAQPGGTVGLDPRDLPPNVDPARTGTLGGIVKIGRKFYVLVSNHAMAANGRATGRQIVFRPRDRFVNNPDDFVFATISNHVHLKQQGQNSVDCALAEIGDEYFDRVNAEFPDQIVTSKTSVKPKVHMEVARVDEIDQTKGTIVSLLAHPRFDFSFGSFDFKNLILIESEKEFARPGDSGALVVGRERAGQEYKVTALVIGGSRRPQKENHRPMFYTYACSFDSCLKELEKTPAVKSIAPKPNARKKIELVFTLS